MKVKLFSLLFLMFVTLTVVIANEDFVGTSLEEPVNVRVSSDIDNQTEHREVIEREVTESLASNTTRTGRNPQTGKEIQIAAGYFGGDDNVTGRATITVDDNVYYTNVVVSVMSLSDISAASELKCGISRDNEVVCAVTPFDGNDTRVHDEEGSIYCWGKNELRECPNQEIQTSTGSGGGKVSVQDIKLNGGDGPESSIESFYQSITDPDDADMLELTYVWYVSEEPKTTTDNSGPSESLSFNFEEIKVEFSSESSSGTIDLTMPIVRIPSNSLVFTTITFDLLANSDNSLTCRTNHLLQGRSCVEEVYSTDRVRVPAENVRPTHAVNTTVPVERGMEVASAARNRTLPVVARGIQTRNVSDEDRERIRAHLANTQNLTGADFGLAVAYSASQNERVKSIRYDEERNVVELDHEEDMRLFGLFNIKTESRTTVHQDGTIETKRPWWSFMAAKGDNPKFKAGADISKSANAQGDDNSTIFDDSAIAGAFFKIEGPDISGGSSGSSAPVTPADPPYCDWCTWCPPPYC